MTSKRKTQFDIGGMSCSFCAETIEKSLSKEKGVEEVKVSLAHEEVLVEYDPETSNESELRKLLKDLGYTIRDPNKTKRFKEQQDELDEGKKDLLVSAVPTLIISGLMIYMLITGMIFEVMALSVRIFSLALALFTMFVPGFYIKKKAFFSLKRGIFNQHVLLESGAFAALIGGLLGLTIYPHFPTVHFFAVATFLTSYHILSEYTSLVVRTKAARAVEKLLDLRPDTARKVTDEGVEEVEVERLEIGDKVRVKPGEAIPVDGEVIEGKSAVDESLVTGESVPVDKKEGEKVIGGSINRSGSLLIVVKATGDEAFLNRIANEIKEARSMKPDIIKLADRVLKYFVPGVLSIAFFTFLTWILGPLVFGYDLMVERAIFASLAVLVLGYPCALGMATPLALTRGGTKAAKKGIFMRSGDAFQVLPEVDVMIFDKTGTITKGEPEVIYVESSLDEKELLSFSASAELFSEHPLGEAIVRYAEEKGVDFLEPDSFQSISGKGVKANIDGEEVKVGKLDWLNSQGVFVEKDRFKDRIYRYRKEGLTVIGCAIEGDLKGLMALGDRVKKDASDTIRAVNAKGIEPIILTGDDEITARAVAEKVGIESVLADVLPDEKRSKIRELQDEGHRVAMIGDGINDAPALMQSDIGIAIGTGTDITIESADIVLIHDFLQGVIDAYDIAEESFKKTKQNLSIAFGLNGIGVALATTGLLHPISAMLAMIVSVSTVLINSFGVRLIRNEDIDFTFNPEHTDTG